MTPELRSALAAVLRQLQKLEADSVALRAILTEAAQRHEDLRDWPQNLEELRNSPLYRAIMERHEPQIARIEHGETDQELIASLAKMLAGRPVN